MKSACNRFWLVVWNIFYFSTIYGIIIPTPNWLIFFKMVKTTKQWVHCVSSKVGGYAWLSFMLCPFGVFFWRIDSPWILFRKHWLRQSAILWCRRGPKSRSGNIPAGWGNAKFICGKIGKLIKLGGIAASFDPIFLGQYWIELIVIWESIGIPCLLIETC